MSLFRTAYIFVLLLFGGTVFADDKQHSLAIGSYKPPLVSAEELKTVLKLSDLPEVSPLSGGFSGGLLYRVNTSKGNFVARRTGGIFGKAGIPQEVSLLTLASKAELAPKVSYQDAGSGLVVMDFIHNILPTQWAPGLLTNWPDLERAVAKLIRDIHKLMPKDKSITDRYMDTYVAQLGGMAVSSKFLDDSTQKSLKELLASKWPRGERVLCHNDMHSRNLLFDGQKVWAIDWEISGWGPKLYDPAVFSNSQAMSRKEGFRFLELYLERVPTQDEKRDFLAMRRLQLAFNVAVNLAFGRPDDFEKEKLGSLFAKSKVKTLRNFFLGADQGLVDLRNPGHMYLIGIVQLEFAEYLIER